MSFSVFRVLPHHLNLNIEFLDKNPSNNKDIGSYKSIGNWHETGYLEFPNPGVPLKLNVMINGSSRIYEALPAHQLGDRFFRQLVPFVDDENPQKFQWPSPRQIRHTLKSGTNKIEISIINLDNKVDKEKIKIIIQPPIMPNSIAINYRLLSFFYFWPVFALLLLISGVRLAIAYRKFMTQQSLH